MSVPPVEPGQGPGPVLSALRATGKSVLVLVLMAAVSAGAAYAVFDWRVPKELAGSAAQLDALRAELRQQKDQQDQLDSRVARVEKAAESASLLMSQNGEMTTLDARLKELDTLRLDLQKSRAEMDEKLKAVEKSVVEQVAKQGQETAQALSVDLRHKSLLIKAQGEILLAQVRWTEGNRGLAKEELGLAVTSLRQALEQAPEAAQPGVKQVLELAEQARSAIILEQSSARDALNLLWHRTGELLAPPSRP